MKHLKLTFIKTLIFQTLKVSSYFGVVFVLIYLLSFKTSVQVAAATFEDNSQATFAGTQSNTLWNTGTSGIELNAAGRTAKTGNYTSEIKSAGNIANFQTFAWTPASPYGKELPNAGVTETVYSSGNANMTGIQYLYHFNDPALATSFTDNSGNTRNATCTSCPTTSIGKLNTAETFVSANSQFITTPTNLTLILGSTFSMSFWIKTTQVGSSTFWQAPAVTGIEQSGAGNDVFLGWIDNTGKINLNIGDASNLKSTANVNDGNWHHVAMSRLLTTGATALYLDGVAKTGVSDTTPRTLAFNSIGRLENSTGPAAAVYLNASLDELAIYNRVITPAEALSIYRRGAVRIKNQIRSCSNSTCTGFNFIGPTSTADFYVDTIDANNTLPNFNITNQANNQYIQYRSTLETDSTTNTPNLKVITITYSAISPSLSFNIRKSDDTADTNACDLGTASTVAVSTCSYRLKVTTNASSGYQVFVRVSGNLSNGVSGISNANPGSGGSGGTLVSAANIGTEKYGILINPGAITGTGSIARTAAYNAGSLNSVQINNTTNAQMVTSTGPNTPVAIDTVNTILVTHNLNISTNTPPGVYTQKVTYTVVPAF